ncbi:MAG: TrkH family potassium uptake protein [Pseudomonadota bacterium]
MLDFRPIFFVIGVLLTTLAVAMAVPAATDALAGNEDWLVFAVSSGFTLFTGGALVLACRVTKLHLTIRQAFLLTTLSWLAITVFAALPLAFANLGLSYTDAFFEAMSGLTTTGSTVIVGLNYAPPGILLWRGILQWLGGIGIIVMAMAVLPFLQVGGMRLFQLESSDKFEKALPRIAQILSGIVIIYSSLVALCAFSLRALGMSWLEAVVHAMATLSTGGFSTADASIGYFHNPAIEWTITVFMLLGGLPFVLYLRAVRGDLLPLVRDSQARWFLGAVLFYVLLMAGWLWAMHGYAVEEALRYAAFNVVSIMTTTGFVTASYDLWGSFALILFFLLMFVGGCAGSSVGSIKIFRYQVLYAAMQAQTKRLLHPHGVFVPYYNRRPVSESVIFSVLSFIFLFMLCFVVLAAGLGLLGLDFLTATSGAATAMANVGPGLGSVIGPDGNFAHLPDAAKWLLAAGMLLGRLEIFTVLVLFAPHFWRD